MCLNAVIFHRLLIRRICSFLRYVSIVIQALKVKYDLLYLYVKKYEASIAKSTLEAYHVVLNHIVVYSEIYVMCAHIRRLLFQIQYVSLNFSY